MLQLGLRSAVGPRFRDIHGLNFTVQDRWATVGGTGFRVRFGLRFKGSCHKRRV